MPTTFAAPGQPFRGESTQRTLALTSRNKTLDEHAAWLNSLEGAPAPGREDYVITRVVDIEISDERSIADANIPATLDLLILVEIVPAR